MAPSRELLQAFLQKANSTRNLGDAIFFFDTVRAPPLPPRSPAAPCDRRLRAAPAAGAPVLSRLPRCARRMTGGSRAGAAGRRCAGPAWRRAPKTMPPSSPRPAGSKPWTTSCMCGHALRARPASPPGECGKRSVPCGVSSQIICTSVSHLLPLECFGTLTVTSSQPQSVLHYRDGACTDVLYTVLDDADFFRPAQVFCLPAFNNG